MNDVLSNNWCKCSHNYGTEYHEDLNSKREEDDAHNRHCCYGKHYHCRVCDKLVLIECKG